MNTTPLIVTVINMASMNEGRIEQAQSFPDTPGGREMAEHLFKRWGMMEREFETAEHLVYHLEQKFIPYGEDGGIMMVHSMLNS